MKKQFITGLCGLFCTAASINYSFAQSAVMLPNGEAGTKPNLEYAVANADYSPPATTAIPFSAVAPKAMKSFNLSFKNATNTKWYALNKNTYLAAFNSKDGRDSRAVFAKNGYMYYAISSGDESSLPKEERHVIKSNYVDYNIGRVNQVSSDGQTVWLVNLQDDNNIIIARTANGALDEYAHYQNHLSGKKHKKGEVVIPQ